MPLITSVRLTENFAKPHLRKFVFPTWYIGTIVVFHTKLSLNTYDSPQTLLFSQKIYLELNTEPSFSRSFYTQFEFKPACLAYQPRRAKAREVATLVVSTDDFGDQKFLANFVVCLQTS